MKIRTDFVTNSSSSSFMVTLNAEFADGTTISQHSHDDSGDFESVGCGFTAKDATGKVIASGSCEPLEYYMENMDEFEMFDPEDIPYEVNDGLRNLNCSSNMNISKISKARSVEELKKVLTKYVGFERFTQECDEEYEEDEEYYEDENTGEVVEALAERFNDMVDSWEEVLAEHLSEVDDLKSMSVSMEFTGRGEFLSGPDDILQKIFGWEDVQNMLELFDEEDEDTIKENLKQMDCMKNLTENSVENIINFGTTCDYAPGMCNVEQSLQKDGKIDISITWDDDLW